MAHHDSLAWIEGVWQLEPEGVGIAVARREPSMERVAIARDGGYPGFDYVAVRLQRVPLATTQPHDGVILFALAETARRDAYDLRYTRAAGVSGDFAGVPVTRSALRMPVLLEGHWLAITLPNGGVQRWVKLDLDLRELRSARSR